MTQAQKVAAWPRIQVEIRPEAQHVTAVLRINGAPQSCASPTVEGMRAGIIARCTSLATTLSRPVAVDVDEAGQRYRIAVRPSGVVQPIDATNSIGDASRLDPVTGLCQQCQQPVAVTAATCAACGLTEPLRVEIRDTPPMPPTSPSATQTTTVPVAARTDYRRTPPPVPEIDEHTVFVGSSNGTYVDGRELTPHTPTIVAASAQLQLGDTHVRLQSRTGSAAQPSSQG